MIVTENKRSTYILGQFLRCLSSYADVFSHNHLILIAQHLIYVIVVLLSLILKYIFYYVQQQKELRGIWRTQFLRHLKLTNAHTSNMTVG